MLDYIYMRDLPTQAVSTAENKDYKEDLKTESTSHLGLLLGADFNEPIQWD